MEDSGGSVVDIDLFNRCRAELGAAMFIRIAGYFKEDAVKAATQIEAGFRARDAVALVAPAHKLKGEALQIGATQLAELAKLIEFEARRCVNHHETPDELLVNIVQLRPLVEKTLAFVEQETNPLVPRVRQPGFGRAQAGFGRATG